VITDSARPEPQLSTSKAKKKTHLPANASLGDKPQERVFIRIFLNALKIPLKCLLSGKAESQNFAPRQRGISSTPVIRDTSIFLITRRIKEMGGAQYATSPSQEAVKASTPAQELV
jgi:hypothetical protein